MLEILLARINYIGAFLFIGFGVFILIDNSNFLKKIIGLNIFQTGIFLFFITTGFVENGSPPILMHPGPYVSPLPQVLILTAIVVGLSLTAVALALTIRIYRAYGTLEEDVLKKELVKDD